MSGTISLGPNRHWISQVWIWNSIRRSIALHLMPSDPELANQFVSEGAEALIEVNLVDLDQDRFNHLIHVVNAAFEGYIHEGPERFTDVDGYADLLRRFSELKCLMYCDPRVILPEPKLGFAVLPSREWSAPGWIFDVVIEQVGSKVALESNTFSTQLLATRFAAGGGKFDLRDLPNDQLAILQHAAEYYGVIYAKHASQCYTDRETFNRVMPHFISFNQFLNSSSK